MSKVGSDLFLVYDSSDDGFSEEQMEMLRFKNATQLSLFPESEKDVVYFASTSSFNNFTFRELVEDYVIRSILDMRQYPDFFGLFSSTKTALDYINSKDLMFTSNERSFMGLIQDGPFSKGEGVPQEAPPRIAVWLGWQIVRAYMDQHPDLTLAQLWEEIDSEKILKESRYKP